MQVIGCQPIRAYEDALLPCYTLERNNEAFNVTTDTWSSCRRKITRQKKKHFAYPFFFRGLPQFIFRKLIFLFPTPAFLSVD